MRVLKSYGTQGEVILGISDCPEDINLSEPVFIQFDGLPVPFFIESAQEKGSNKLLVKIEDIDSLEDAEELVGREVSLSMQELPQEEEDNQLIGMMVYDQNNHQIGPILAFNDFSGNTCLTVDYNGEEVIVPFNEELIIKFKNNALYLMIPDGLL